MHKKQFISMKSPLAVELHIREKVKLSEFLILSLTFVIFDKQISFLATDAAIVVLGFLPATLLNFSEPFLSDRPFRQTIFPFKYFADIPYHFLFCMSRALWERHPAWWRPRPPQLHLLWVCDTWTRPLER